MAGVGCRSGPDGSSRQGGRTGLPGWVFCLVRERNGALFEGSSDRLMAVSSAFRLGVLKVLMEKIEAGGR